LRELNSQEIENIGFLSANNIPFGLIEVTQTGLSKSILDATEDFREFLAAANVHDFKSQVQGPDGKVKLNNRLWVTEQDHLDSSTSLYRPVTKMGDPRLWVSNLRNICEPGDIFVATHTGGLLDIWNLADIVLDKLNPALGLGRNLATLGRGKVDARLELESLLRDLNKRGWIKGQKTGTTAVGHLLETELGISQNSSKKPDFKGIEIKASAARKRGGTRVNLFAKVADWDISSLKSSREILNKFGYHRPNDFRLYCTVQYGIPNSQGLYFDFDPSAQHLNEVSTSSFQPDVASWRLTTLQSELQAKHQETFWVTAKSQRRTDGTYFKYESVVNTKNPMLVQFLPLIFNGTITLDHLIKMESSGRVSEKGPLFKIKSDSLAMLFPSPAYIDLSN
jgi:hypothetical protein